MESKEVVTKKKRRKRTKDSKNESKDEMNSKSSRKKDKRKNEKVNESETKRKRKKKKKKEKKEKKEKNEIEDEHNNNINKNIETYDNMSINTIENNKIQVDLRECVSCKDWISVEEMYFLDMCSHKYCKHCWNMYCNKILKNEDIEMCCVICKGIITQNDLMFGLEIQEYLQLQVKYEEIVKKLYNDENTNKCSSCNNEFTNKQINTLLPQLNDSVLRESLSCSSPNDIQMILEEIEVKLSIKCGKCKKNICSICGKLSGMENGHSTFNCNIIPSLVILEILDNLEKKLGWENEKTSKSHQSSFSLGKSKASGIGFAGSQNDSYHEVDKAKKRESEERKVVSQILKILSYFFPNDFSYKPHISLYPIIKNSCLLKLMTRYLRNDWLMDSNAQDSDLYFSVLAIIRGLSLNPVMFGLIMIPLGDDDNSDSLRIKLQNLNKQTEFFMKKVEQFGSEEGADVTHILGLSLDIQGVYNQVEEFAIIWETGRTPSYLLTKKEDISNKLQSKEEPSKKSRLNILKKKKKHNKHNKNDNKSKNKQKEVIVDPIEKEYMEKMIPLQFEFQNPFPKSLQSVKYLDNMQRAKSSPVTSPQVLMRISQELSSLATSLPLSINSGVFMRVNEEKVNEIRFIIIGPAGTPYENGCFEFEMIITYEYPSKPPCVQIMTTGNGSVRFNPNLYNNGKVCLSLLGTWSGPGWDPKVSTLLQVLVSIQSLIMVPDPYFNEPGYEATQGTASGNRLSENYNLNIRLRTMQEAMLSQLRKPTPGFEEVIHNHFYIKRKQIIAQCNEWKKGKSSEYSKVVSEIEDEIYKLS